MDRTDLFHIGQYPDLKIEILPMTDYQQHDLDNQHIVTIPLDTDLTLPYGLMYANEPSEALKKFLRIVKKLTW